MHMRLTTMDNNEHDFTDEEVSPVLHSLKSGKAVPDVYPPEIFQNAGHNLITGITNTLNNI